MVSSTATRAALSLSGSSPSTSSVRSRSLLAKSLRRFLRSIRTEFRLFRARPSRRRPWTIPLLVVSIVTVVLLIVLRFAKRSKENSPFHEPDRERSHFSHNVHRFLPRQPVWEAAMLSPCSWLYLEFGARDGRHLDAFFSDGNSFLEEYLRATQSSMRAFCGLAFEPNVNMDPFLMEVRKIRGKKAFRFNAYTGVVPGAMNATEEVRLRGLDDGKDEGEQAMVQSLDLKDTVKRLTFDWKDSGKEVSQMNTARGNGNSGTVVLRFNVNDIREAFWYLDLLEGGSVDGVMCQRIDRLIINLQKMPIDPASRFEVEDAEVVREWDKLATPPKSPLLDSRKGVAGLVTFAKEANERRGCRTTIHVIDETGRGLTPSTISEREVFYAILAGKPTFDERISAQTETWMTAVPQDRLTIFTNEQRNGDEMRAARGRDTVVTQPHNPSLEQQLPLMQSWSHLVRVRESWDRTMKDNSEIKWLALVDDDTFVFPGGIREYLSMFDHRLNIWGGSGEQARIDNGDAGIFANWLRDLHKKYGGKHCYLRTEDVPKTLQGSHIEYGVSQVLNGRKVAHKVSHMCDDTFCRIGCPAVPQGAAIFLSRALVEALRPHIEKCEADTSGLCKNCGSQRLYMCVNRYTTEPRTLLTRGICRAPWKLEHRERFPFVLTFHGFNRYHGMALSTDSLRGDMVELWQLGKTYEEGVKKGYKSSYLVPMPKVADLIGCHGQGRFHDGECITSDGIKLAAADGKGPSEKSMQGQRPSDRNGSA